MRKLLNRSIVAVALLAAFVPAGCSDPVSPQGAALDDARSRWAAGGHDAYTFRYEQFCFCPAEGPIDIRVAADSVVAATVVRTGEPVPGEQLTWYSTIDGLFDRLQAALDEEPVQFEVEYDGEFGFPSSASIDISPQIADEEYSFTVENFTPGN
jgi:hypothetical protein